MENKFSKFINLQGKYLTSLLILLALSIGNVWGADPDLALGTDAQLSSDFLGEYSTPGITLSSTSSFSSGAVQLNSTPSAYDANYFEVLSSSAEIEKVSFLISGNGSNKSIQAPVFAWATTATGNTADTYVLLDAVTVTANSYAVAQWFEYDLSAASVKCARIYRTTKNISSTSPAYTGSSTALGSGQTIKIWGIKVWLKSTTPATSYTVTIDPNGGSYSETPDGWTLSAGVYTKSIAAGEFTPPTTGLTKGTDDLSWKDNHGTDITFPITLAKDSTFIAQWTAHSVSSDATLSALTVDGVAVDGFAAATEEYNVVLPFGTTVVPTVAGTANDANAKSVVVTQASSVSGDAIVVVTAENDDTKTYTIHFSVATTKLIDLVWKTGQSACEGAGSQASQIKSNNSAVSGFIKPISFINAEGSGDNAAEGSSLNTGKKAGNTIILQTQPGYLFTTMSFFGKIESEDTKCQISIDGGDTWSDLMSTSSGDATYCNVVSGASTSDIRIKSAGVKGTWIRNMQLTVTPGCSPIAVSWTSEPAAEYELGKAATAIAAAANSGGTITYASDATSVIEVAADGALTLKALGTANLSASAPAGDGTLFCDASGDEISKSIKTYYLVTFDPQNEEAASSTKYYAGDAAIALPSAPSWPGHSFQGWFDAASAGNQITEAVTPTASRTIYAQWTLDCAGATITTQPAGANYLIGRTAAALSCVATAGNGGKLTYTWYSCEDALGTNPVELAGAPTPSTAAAATFYYYCEVTEAGCATIATSNIATVTVAPKDGVSIISIAVSNGNGSAQTINASNITGIIGGTGTQKLQNGATKLGSNGHYIGFTLANSETLKAGDVIRLNVSATNGASHLTLYQDASDANLVKDIEWAAADGVNLIPLPAEAVGLGTLYIYRKSSACNPSLSEFTILRPINPMLTAITINGEAGVIDEDLKTVAVELQPGYNLAALTIVPTIVSNTPQANVVKTVTTNSGNWIIGDNTYRLTDKDGDYTEYTVTLTAGQLKHNVTFNTHGGSAVDPQKVVDGEHLAAAPTAPTKEDYIFQYWSLTDGGVEVDVTSIVINKDTTFHAVWAPDGAIKLLDGSTVNTTNFITGVTATTVNFDDADHNCVIFAGTVSGVNGVKDLDRVIAYNATTTQTRIQLSLHNTSTNSRQVYVKGVVEGSADVVDIASITLGNQETMTTAYYNFDNASNRTIYIIVPNSAGNVCFLQVKVIETGTDLPMFGQAGYSMNLNKGRIFGRAPSAISNFEGLHVESLGADYQPTSSTVGRFYLGKSISFDVTSNVLMSITAANNKTYYVTKGAAGTDNETSKQGVSEFDLTAGTWFITAGTEDMQFTNIAFMLPKCAEPAFNSLVNSDVCEGDPYVALNGTATVADAGVPTYQWYKEDNTPIDGATNAEYTPAEDGKYYVIAINHLDGFSDNEKKSELVSVASVASTVINEAPKNVRKDAGESATLTVDASGKNLHYAWKESDAIDGTYTDVAGAADAASLDVTVPTGVKFYKVVITSDCGEAIEAIAKVEEWVELSQVDVTATTEWDWANAGGVKIAPTKNVEILMANIKDGDNIMPNDASFNSQALLFSGQESCVSEGGRWFAKGAYIKFNTTVPGAIFVQFSDNGSNNRRVRINGKLSDASASKTDIKTFMVNVPAGEVELMGVSNDGATENQYIRFHKITFVKTDYTREVNSGRYGTICLPNGGKMYGAALYEVAYLDAGAKKIFFDEVLNGEMVAGTPYIFLPNDGIDLLAVAYSDEANAPAGSMNGLVGSYTQELLAKDAGNYILYNNQYLEVNSDDVYVGANRAYIKMAELPTTAKAPVPGRRRVAMGVAGREVPTALDHLNASEQPIKVIIDGQLFILRGEQMFDATGRLVK